MARALATLARQPVPVSGSIMASGNEITDVVRAAGLSGDGRAAPDSSYGIWEATTNLCSNGGFEAGLAGWVGGGGNSGAPSTAAAKFGRASLKATWQTGGSVFIMAYHVTLTAVPYTASMWINIPGSWDGGTVRVGLLSFTSAVIASQPNANMALVDQWQRIQVTFTPNSGALTGYVCLEISGFMPSNGKYISIDGVQIEAKGYATPYVETNGATATRPSARIQLPTSILRGEQGWIAICARMGVPSASLPAQSFLWTLRSNDANYLAMFYDPSVSLWFMRTNLAGVVSQVASAVATFAAGDIVLLIGYWSSLAKGISLLGQPFVVAGGSAAPAGTGSHDLGSYAGANLIDGAVLWACGGIGTLQGADAATLHSMGNTDPTMAQVQGLSGSAAQPTFLWTADTAVYQTPGRLQAV